MPRKPSQVSNSLLTSSKQYDEDRPSQDSVTSRSSALSQDTFNLDQTDQFSTSGDSDSVEDDQKQLIRKQQNRSKSRRNETDDQRKRRLERMQLNNNKRKSKETFEDRKRYLEYNKEYQRKRNTNETVEQRERRLEKARQFDLLHRTLSNVELRELGRKKQRKYVAKCKTKNQIEEYGQHPKNWQENATRASIEQYYITEESDDDFKNIKIEPSNEESEQLCYSSASTSISDPLNPLMALRPTPAAEVICLQQISEAVSEESHGDASPLASYRRYQEQEGAGVQLHRLKEFKKCFPEYGDKASAEKRELSEEKLRQLAIKHVDALRVICHRINIRQYLPKCGIKESVEQDEQHHSKTIKCENQLVSENVKHELQDESTPTSIETVEQHEQSLAKAHSLCTHIGDSVDADIHLHNSEDIKTELSSPGYDQICEVTASDSIADLQPNVKVEDITLGECDPLGGINGVSVKTENNDLEKEYEVEKVIKMEIDIEYEGPQQIKPRECKNSMVGAIKVRNIKDLQKPLAKEIKGNINNTTNTVTIRTYTRKKRINTLPPALQQCIKKPRQDVPILKENENVVQELCQQNIVRQCVPSSRTEKSVEQVSEMSEDITQRNAFYCKKYRLRKKCTNQGVVKRKSNSENCRQYRQRKKLLAQQLQSNNEVIHSPSTSCLQMTFEPQLITTDPKTEGGCYISAQEIESGPSEQEYNQLCKVTASEDIEESKLNVNDDVVYKINLHDGVASNNIRTEDTVVEGEYDDGKVLKMEYDVESEGVQQTEFKDNNFMVDHNKVQEIDDTMQKLLEKQEKEDVEATRIHRTTENKKYRCYGRLNISVPNESFEQRENCLEKLVDGQKRIPNESGELLQQCLNNIKNVEKSIANESVVQSEQICTSLSLIYESEKRESLLKEHQKNKAESQRTNETVKQRQRRPKIHRQYYVIKVKGELSDEQRKQRAEYKRQWYLNRISNESAEEREQRRKRKRAYNSQRLANETVEQRKERIEKKREYDKKRKAISLLEQCEQLRMYNMR